MQFQFWFGLFLLLLNINIICINNNGVVAEVVVEGEASVLEPIDYLRDQDVVNIKRHGNIDVVNNEQQIGLCHIGVFIPYSRPGGGQEEGVSSGQQQQQLVPNFPRLSEGQMAAAFLAMDMLNRGDGSVIKEIQGLNETCPIRFTGETFDTRFSSAVAMNSFMDALDRDNDNHDDDDSNQPELCAILGPVRSSAATAMGVVAGVANIPHMAYVAKASQLDDKSQYPTFGRLTTSDEGDAYIYVVHLKELDVQHLGVIHYNDAFGSSYARALRQIAQQIHPTLQFVMVDLPASTQPSQEDYQNAVNILKSSGFRWFIGIFAGPRDYSPIMTEAMKQGIAGTGGGTGEEQYVWHFTATLGQSNIRNLIVPKGSPIAVATHGIGMIRLKGGLPGQPVFDKFVTKFKSLNNPQDLEYLQSKMPTYPDHPNYVPTPMDSNVFADPIVDFLAFPFDEIIMLGLSACRSFTTAPTLALDGKSMYDRMLLTRFQGASGDCTLDPITGTRIPSSASYQVVNFLEKTYNDTHVTFVSQASKSLINGIWVEVTPFIFNDNTSTVPPDLPSITINKNFIGTGLRVTGLAMASLVMALSLGFSGWTLNYHENYVVKASQPIFLHIVCGGTFIMGSSIIPLSIDDEIASQKGCGKACMAVPWLLSTGFVLVFSAVWSKTLRVNRVLGRGASRKLKRVKVRTLDVVAPLVGMLTANFVVLSAWTAIAPLEWAREVTSVDRFNRTVESSGHCTSEEKFLPFLIVIVILNLGALILTSYQCYLARGITIEFAESEYIFMAVGCMLLVSFVSIPVMLLASGKDQKVHYFAMTSIIFVLSTAVLLFIFIPKIDAVKRKIGPEAFKKAMRSMSFHFHSRGSTSKQLQQEEDPFSFNGEGLMVFDARQQMDKANREIDGLRTENCALRSRVEDLEALLADGEDARDRKDEEGMTESTYDESNRTHLVPVPPDRGDDDAGPKRIDFVSNFTDDSLVYNA